MSIPRKLKPCIDCFVPSYIFSHGRCRNCYAKDYVSKAVWSESALEELSTHYKTKEIKRKPLKPKDEYKEFFESLVIPERCEECNQQLLAFNNFGRRCCSAHILPKSSFKSVAKRPDNILYLGASVLGGCACHNKFDNCVDSRKSMRVYEIALTRLESFKHLLTDKELVMAEKYLGI